MKEFRADKESAREIFEFLLPDEKIRRRCLQFLVNSIQTANRLGADRWGITLYKNYALMNCGSIEILQIHPDWMHVITDSKSFSELSLGNDVKIDRGLGKGKGYYTSAPGSVACDFETKQAAKVLPQVQESHLAVIHKAVRAKLISGRKKAHSPGVIEFLNEYLSQSLLQPAYFNPEFEEKYQIYLAQAGNVVEFYDEPANQAHDLFQRWRRDNWNTGYFINCKSRNRLVLHQASCQHPGDGEWASEDFGDSLTTFRKVCSSSLSELYEWARQQISVVPEACKDCLPDFETGLFDNLSAFPDVDQVFGSIFEGRKKYVVHLQRERNPKIVAAKKRQVLSKTNKLCCEACGFDFRAFYGERGAGFCEAHHTKPLAELDEGTETKLEDLIILCSNCHRMIHREPMLSLEELRRLLADSHPKAKRLKHDHNN